MLSYSPRVQRESNKREYQDMLTNSFAICSPIFLASVNRDIDFGVTAAVLFSKSEHILQACFFSLRAEIQQTTTEELLFRTDSFCTRFLSASLKQIGGKFLKSTLTPMFKAIDSSPDIETDPLRCSSPEEHKENALNLVTLCSSLLKKLTTALQKINPLIAHILLEVYNQVHDIYPRAATKSLGAILFLRFIFPAFTQPIQYKLLSSCSPVLKRKLVIVAKILQCIFNEVVRREDEWLPFAPFILKHIDTNRIVYESLLICVQNAKVSRKYFISAPRNEFAEALDTFAEICEKNFSVFESYSNDKSLIHEMLLATHRQALIMATAIPLKETIMTEAAEFLQFLRHEKGTKQPDMGPMPVRRRASFVDVPIPQGLLEEMCDFVISQHPPANLFLKYIQGTTHSDTLQFLDVALNEVELHCEEYPLKVIVQALNKYLITQPILADSTPPIDIDGSISQHQQVEKIFQSISSLTEEKIFKMSTLFTLFENVIVCAEDPPFDKLAQVLLPMLYSVSTSKKSQFKSLIKALEILLHNIGEVLNLLPRRKSSNIKFNPPPDLDTRDWQLLCINAQTIHYDPGDVILLQGAANTDLYFVQNGSVDLMMEDVFMATIHEGEYFGDISFITESEARTTVTAKTECIIQRMAADFVLRVIECDANLFEKFYFMVAKFTVERFVKQTNAWNGVKLLPPATPKPSHVMPIEIFFSDGTSQWFECTTTQTIKALRDHISNTIERGKTLCDVAYSRLYESCINPVSNERQYSVLEDTWFVESIFTRAKYATRHCVYFLLEDPTVTQNEFSLSTAFIINEFSCKSRNCKGTLYIIPKHLVFYSKNLSHSKKKKEKTNQLFIKLRQYNLLTLEGTKLTLSDNSGNNEKFRFVNAADSFLAYQTVKYLHPQLEAKMESNPSSTVNDDNHAIVIEEFIASAPDEISVSPGQVVTVLHRSHEFCKVEDSSKTQKGKIPISSLKFLTWNGNSLDTTSRVAEHLSKTIGETSGAHLPSYREWLKILAVSKLHVYRPGEVILRRGSIMQRMYILVQGCCLVRASDETVLARMEPGEIFGEISLITGSATANVVAAPPESKFKNSTSMIISNSSPPAETTIAIVIEADYLKRLFMNDKKLAGKFYKYVAFLTQQRLINRTKLFAESQTKREL